MCTLVVAHRQYAEWPLIVAANRDERLERPSTPPRIWPGLFWAPRDEVVQGTWLGLNAHGLFVGITNRFPAENDPGRESRGKLVLEALRSSSAKALHTELANLSALRFNSFHLLYADRDAVFMTWSDGELVRQSELAPGLHVVTERSLGGDDQARTERVQASWPGRSGAPSSEALAELMAQHGGDNPVGGTCIHLPHMGYGTRSSLQLFLAPSLAQSRLYWAEGAPCTVSYRDQSKALAGLTTGTSPNK